MYMYEIEILCHLIKQNDYLTVETPWESRTGEVTPRITVIPSNLKRVRQSRFRHESLGALESPLPYHHLPPHVLSCSPYFLPYLAAPNKTNLKN